MLMTGPAASTHGEIYNLGHLEVVSLTEFVDLLLQICPGSAHRLVPFPAETRRIDIGDYFGSYEKIRQAIGWEPKVALADGLARTIAYYRENLEHYLQ